jgi:hypothetical protein
VVASLTVIISIWYIIHNIFQPIGLVQTNCQYKKCTSSWIAVSAIDFYAFTDAESALSCRRLFHLSLTQTENENNLMSGLE